MARVWIALVLLSAVAVGAGVVAVVHRAPTGSGSGAAATKPAGTQGSALVPAARSGVPQTPGTAGRPDATARGSVSAAAAPKPSTGLHFTFSRPWHPVTYEVRGPQKPPVRLVCSACPADTTPGNAATNDARVTLLEWTP